MKHGKRDANHREIIQALRDAYISVVDLADVARGCPDILAGGINRVTGQPMTTLLEIKTESGKLTPDQVEFIDSWRGTVHIVRTPAEALRVFGIEI